jgi:hypothetical protein
LQYVQQYSVYPLKYNSCFWNTKESKKKVFAPKNKLEVGAKGEYPLGHDLAS